MARAFERAVSIFSSTTKFSLVKIVMIFSSAVMVSLMEAPTDVRFFKASMVFKEELNLIMSCPPILVRFFIPSRLTNFAWSLLSM